MKFTFYTEDITQLRSDLCAILCFEEAVGEGTVFQSLDRALGGLLTQLVAEEQFKGKKGQSLQVHSHGKVAASRVLLIGAGPRREFQPGDLRGLSSRGVRAGHAIHARHVTVVIPYLEGAMQERAAQFLAEGAILGGYQFDRYITGERKRPLSVEELCLAMTADNVEPSRLDPIRHGVQRGEQVARGVQLARDLVNEPAAEITPRKMAEIATRLAKEHHLEAKVYGPKECEKMGMGMFLAVAQGSEEEPRFIHLIYKPRGKAAP
jgi:leucyl aminopeptidase